MSRILLFSFAGRILAIYGKQVIRALYFKRGTLDIKKRKK